MDAMTRPASEGVDSAKGWRVTAASFVGLIFGPSTVAVMAQGLFVSSFEKEFGWTRTQVSLAASILALSIMVATPLQGWLIDRYGARRIVLISVPLFAASIAALAFQTGQLWQFYLLWAVIPFAAVGLWPVGYLRVVSGWFERRLGLSTGIANAGIGAGSSLIPLIVGAIIAAYGWRAAYETLALLVLVVTLPVAYFFIVEHPRADAALRTRASAAAATEAFRSAARTRPFVVLLTAFFFLGFINVAFVFHQIPLLTDAGLPLSKAVQVQAVFGVFIIVGRLAVGFVLDYFRANAVMIVVAVAGALASTLYAMGQTSGVTVFLCSALGGMVVGAEFDVLSVLIKRRFGIEAFGRLYGLTFALFQLGSAICVYILPLLRAQTGNYALGFGMVTVTTLIAVAALALIDMPGRAVVTAS